MKLRMLSMAALAALAIACNKDPDSADPTAYSGNIEDMQVPESFSYRTSENVSVNVQVEDLFDLPIGGVMVNFYSADPIEGGEFIANAMTDQSGVAASQIRVPAYLETMFVEVAFPGFANSTTVDVKPSISLNFGGKPNKRALKKSTAMDTTAAGGKFFFIGNFNNQGVPTYLETTGDVLSTEFLSDVNSSFPERRSVPAHNPQYLASGNQLDVVLTQPGDVYVTFVTEGAGYKNVLAYYVFDSNNPPTDPSQIDSLFVVFPNASFSGSGGGLEAGDKVKLGTFPAGKTISWAILANGWKNNGTLNLNKPVYYSKTALNTVESDPNKRQHSVQLVDNARQLLVNGFEDLKRTGKGSDDDFNDLVFYATVTPWSACDKSNIPPTTITQDGDGDGAPDDVDEFPSDPSRAYTCTYDGTLAFEDLWPSQGDYDFNDMVVDYDITQISDANNDVVELGLDYTLRAAGTGFNNGFGFQFENVAPTAVQSVNGQNLQEGYVVNNPNGTEQNQQLATIIVFDNLFNIMPNPGTKFINTVVGETNVSPETLSLSVNFVNPVDLNDLGLPPYNPFIIIKKNRGAEVHLPDMMPTDLADLNLLGSVDDDSDAGSGKYYKTVNNLPWALNITGQFDYPIEYQQIDDAYIHFAPWAMSGGLQYSAWFVDIPGYRDLSKIY
jgi:LruC domain-containing protein